MVNPNPIPALTAGAWSALVDHVRATPDPLEDGAIARADLAGGDSPAIAFYATELNKPSGWTHPIAETLPRLSRPVSIVGRARRDPATGAVQIEMEVAAAAQAVAADYEGGALDLDEVAYEMALERAVEGTEADRTWVAAEFHRLLRLVRPTT